MNDYPFPFHGADLVARASGALWWPDAGLLCVSDLHLGKSERVARRGGTLLPPYEIADTLTRLERELDATGARTVLCLGDSFDDAEAAEALPEAPSRWLGRLIAGRDWYWLEGNHDPAPTALPGSPHASLTRNGLTFRHIATPEAEGEISGHYHPKARIALRGAALARPCFLIDQRRVLLPAFGTYTGGLATTSPALCALMAPSTLAVLTGTFACAIPMPRHP